ncbi:hypothetical protein GCM10010348_76770 [Streptomyces anthocyanicus]|uniref:hypothetical protein n=1 Tax=Streptomyces anthocyanicus TaxID=68174 RepID=UPI0018736F12|nr:hypothetical protein [Streptomyces anthocyanicus]GHC38119.1 hypothetical protein GCM10010348_76770 [Streptomyces anthocyanicus]
MKGASIEIIDRGSSDSGILVPSAVRINGVEVPIPSGTKIRVHDVSDDEAVTVTLTMLVRRVVIAAEDDV